MTWFEPFSKIAAIKNKITQLTKSVLHLKDIHSADIQFEFLLTYSYSLNSPPLPTYLHITDFPILCKHYQEQITNQKNIATTDFLKMTQILNLHVTMLYVDKPWKSLLCSQQFELFVVFHANALFVMIYCIKKYSRIQTNISHEYVSDFSINSY